MGRVRDRERAQNPLTPTLSPVSGGEGEENLSPPALARELPFDFRACAREVAGHHDLQAAPAFARPAEIDALGEIHLAPGAAQPEAGAAGQAQQHRLAVLGE